MFLQVPYLLIEKKNSFVTLLDRVHVKSIQVSSLITCLLTITHVKAISLDNKDDI